MPTPPKMQGQPTIRRDADANSIFLEVLIQGANEAETKWYFGDNEIEEGNNYKFHVLGVGGEVEATNVKLYQCEIKNNGMPYDGTYKAIFMNNEGIFRCKFELKDDSQLCRHTDTNFECCRLYTDTNFDRTHFTHDHQFCRHEH